MIQEIAGHRVYVCAIEGPPLADDRNLSGLIGDLFSNNATVAAIPLARMGGDFLRLSSGVAGAVLQKLVNYRFLVAILGDVAPASTASEPLSDFIRESNRGQSVWFTHDLVALEAKLWDVQGRA